MGCAPQHANSLESRDAVHAYGAAAAASHYDATTEGTIHKTAAALLSDKPAGTAGPDLLADREVINIFYETRRLAASPLSPPDSPEEPPVCQMDTAIFFEKPKQEEKPRLIETIDFDDIEEKFERFANSYDVLERHEIFRELERAIYDLQTVEGCVKILEFMDTHFDSEYRDLFSTVLDMVQVMSPAIDDSLFWTKERAFSDRFLRFIVAHINEKRPPHQQIQYNILLAPEIFGWVHRHLPTLEGKRVLFIRLNDSKGHFTPILIEKRGLETFILISDSLSSVQTFITPLQEAIDEACHSCKALQGPVFLYTHAISRQADRCNCAIFSVKDAATFFLYDDFFGELERRPENIHLAQLEHSSSPRAYVAEVLLLPPEMYKGIQFSKRGDLRYCTREYFEAHMNPIEDRPMRMRKQKMTTAFHHTTLKVHLAQYRDDRESRSHGNYYMFRKRVHYTARAVRSLMATL